MKRLAVAAAGFVLGAVVAHWWDDADGRVRRVADDADRARAELRQWRETMARIDQLPETHR